MMSFDLRILLNVSNIFNRLWTNTETLLTQTGGDPLISGKILSMELFFWRFTLWKSNIQSKILQIKLILKAYTVGKTMNMVEFYLPSQFRLVTSVSKRFISKDISNPMEIFLMGIFPRIPWEIFKNWSPKILMLQMCKIWQYLPWHTKIRSTNGVFFNTDNGTWVLNCKDLHVDWKENQGKNKLVHFSVSTTKSSHVFMLPSDNPWIMCVVIKRGWWWESGILFNFPVTNLPKFYVFALYVIIVAPAISCEGYLLGLDSKYNI